MSRQISVWQHLALAPHRSLFLVGALQGVLTMLWWVFDLAGRYQLVGSAFVWPIAPIWAHAFLMIYAFFPFFIFGFLFTTYPNWMSGEKIPSRHFLATCLLMAVGVSLFYLGLITNKLIIAAGIAVMLTGWGIALYALLRVLLTAPGKDKRHAITISLAFLFGWLGMAAYLLWLLTDNGAMLNFSRYIGIWFFLLPIVLTVSHKMIPFFSSSVLDNYVLVRPYWILWLMLSCSISHGILQWVDALSYSWLTDFTLAISALYLSFTWGLLRSFQVGLLAVLHISFAWLSISMLLYGIQSLALLFGRLHFLYLAPLHALAIGYFASMILAMASRVTIGHAGRPLILDNVTWWLFIGFQAAAIFRVLPDIAPTAISNAPLLYLIAGSIWLVCFVLWAARYAPIFWRKRVDNKPG